MPVTKEEVEEQRVRIKEINARPVKKVAEAIGRKHRRAKKKLSQMLAKAGEDQRAKEKVEGLSVRKVMRSTMMSHAKKKPMDQKEKGEKYRYVRAN
eukprot:gene20157-7213_t